jgi:hypothetical protein
MIISTDRSVGLGGGWLTLEETSLVVWYIQAKDQSPPLTISSRMQRPTLRITAVLCWYCGCCA